MTIPMRTLLALLLVAGCTTSGDRCPAPKVPTFSCEPIAAGSPGCVGSCHMLCGVNEDVSTPLDNATFPIGCSETLTACGGPFPDSPLTCECTAGGWTGGC